MPPSWKRLLHGWGTQELGVLAAIVVLAAVITATNPRFLTLENGFDLLSRYALLGILSLGLMVVLVSGGIDISFVAVATVAQYLTVWFVVSHGGGALLGFAMAMGIGTALGAANALAIHFLRIPSIVATIGMMEILYGLVRLVSGGRWIYNLPDWFRELGTWRLVEFQRADGTPYGLSFVAVVFLASVVVTALILRGTLLGRKVYAFGGNPVAAERAGLGVLRIRLFAFGFMGLLAGVGAMVHALYSQTVAPNALEGRELKVFAAVVLGGASLTGGVGTTRGTVLGVALIAVMSNGLTLMRVPSTWNKVAIGAVILASVTASALRDRKRNQGRVLT